MSFLPIFTARNLIPRMEKVPLFLIELVRCLKSLLKIQIFGSVREVERLVKREMKAKRGRVEEIKLSDKPNQALVMLSHIQWS